MGGGGAQMTEGWFWSHPEWLAFARAKGGESDVHVGAANLVVRLGSEGAMWNAVRKGHRADIKAAKRDGVVVIEASNVAGFSVYARIHSAVAKKPRPNASYRAQRRSVLSGNARVFVAIVDGVAEVGAAYFYVYEHGSYYASAARTDDAPRGVAHALVWAAMVALSVDRDWLDMGPEPKPTDSEKDEAIAHFKRGFGAESIKDWRFVLP